MKQDYKIIETERLILKPFSTLSEEEKKKIGKSWKNPFNARFNGQRKPYSAVEEISKREEPTFSIIEKSNESYYDTMYFRAVFDKETGDLIGTCRFGMYYKTQSLLTWDFGFNIILKHWSKGYGVELLKGICDFAHNNGACFMVGGASNDNFGSYHAMVKSGFVYNGIDSDNDFQFMRNLTLPMPNQQEINKEWEKHIQRYIERKDEKHNKFGAEKYNKLNEINALIKEMVNRIHNGEDEDKLVKEYYKKCKSILKFPEKSVGF